MREVTVTRYSNLSRPVSPYLSQVINQSSRGFKAREVPAKVMI